MAYPPFERPSAGFQNRGRGGDTAASLIFGGGAPAPPAGATHQRGGASPGRRRPCSAAACAGAAGAHSSHMPDARATQEELGARRQRAQPRSIAQQYDDFYAAQEDQAFDALRSTLNKLERKAEREHNLYSGAAGYSTEKRVEKSDRRIDEPRQRTLTTPRGNDDSVASLISHPAMYDRPTTASSPTKQQRTGQPGLVPPLQARGGSDVSMASSISARRRQNSARRMAERPAWQD